MCLIVLPVVEVKLANLHNHLWKNVYFYTPCFQTTIYAIYAVKKAWLTFHKFPSA